MTPARIPTAYLAHPLRGDPDGPTAAARAVRAAARVLVLDFALRGRLVDVQAPQLDLAWLLRPEVPDEDALAMRLCLARVERADLLLAVIYDLVASDGVAKEIRHAEAHRVPVVRVDVATNEEWDCAEDRGLIVGLVALHALEAEARPTTVALRKLLRGGRR